MRRPNVPEDLKPKIATRAEELSRPAIYRAPPEASPEPQPRQAASGVQQGPAGPGQKPQGNNSAVALQVLEGQQAAATVAQGANNRPVAPPKLEEQQSRSQDIKLSGELSEEDKAYVRELRARDREVRAHEAAHATAGSGYTSSPNFEYVRGPDGVQYAVGGHVSIDTSTVPDDPEATVAKMEVVRQAALAPARPSGQDRAVASAAEQSLRAAQAELQEQRAAEQQEQLEGSDGPGEAPADAFGLAEQNETEAGLAPEGPAFGVNAPRPEVQQPTAISIDLIA